MWCIQIGLSCLLVMTMTVNTGSEASTMASASQSQDQNQEDPAIMPVIVLHPEQLLETIVAIDPMKLTTVDIPSSAVTVLFQAHSHNHMLTLSLEEELVESRYTNGSDIGVLVDLDRASTEASCYVRCSTCTRNNTVTVGVMATYLSSTDPVPGACNMEFPLENDPNLIIPAQKYLNPVQFQFANFGKQRGQPWLSCESASLQKRLIYDVYQLYLSTAETNEAQLMQNLKLVLNKTEFLKHAKKVQTVQYPTKPQVYFSSYYGQGVAYAVLVSQNIEFPVASSLYVPIITYNCQYNADGSCNMKTAGIVTMQVVSVFLAVAGAALCFVGHKIFKTSMFVFGFLAFTLIFLTVFLRFSSWSIMTVVLSSLSFGVLGGLAWLAVWYYLGRPVLSVLLPGLVMGYLLASIIFVTSPLGDLAVLKFSYSYGMAFTCALLLPVVLLMAFSRVLHVFSCNLVGSFLVIFAFDQFTYGNLQHILSTSIKKSVSNDFLLVHTTWPPFSLSDQILAASWGVLCVSGAVFQYWHERGRRPFPPCPYRESVRQTLFTAVPRGPTERDPLNAPTNTVEEEEPVPVIRNYGAVGGGRGGARSGGGRGGGGGAGAVDNRVNVQEDSRTHLLPPNRHTNADLTEEEEEESYQTP